MDKSLDAFRTISEVAEDLDLPQHVLRFWETRFNQIKPLKRGGGRRYYRPDDVDLVKGIKHLLYGEGYTIKGVQRILKEEGVKCVQSIWREGSLEQVSLKAEPQSEIANNVQVASVQPQNQNFTAIQSSSADRATEQLRKAENALSAAAQLMPDDCQKLKVALQTLSECRRILSDTLSETENSDKAAA